MAKKGRHPKRAAGFRPTFEPDPVADAEVTGMFEDVIFAVEDDDPFDLLMQASAMIDALDQRNTNPYERVPGDPDGDDTPTLDEIVFFLTQNDAPETTYLLAAFSALIDDTALSTRCRRALIGRRHPRPRWLTDLGESAVTRTILQTHALGDGDNVLIELTPPGGPPFTMVVYVDHNAGHVVKDAFGMPAPIDELVTQFRRIAGDDPAMDWVDIDAATARARLVDAIGWGAMTWPPYETDTWPAARPLLEWILTLMPVGGVGYDPGDDLDARNERLTAQLTEGFFASPFAKGLDDADHRSLFETLCWFGTGYGSNDPMQWSPVRVEILLGDWLPRKVIAPTDYLALAPDLVRALISYTHAERGIPPALTTETLDAVDTWEPGYLTRIAGEDDPDDFIDFPGLDIPGLDELITSPAAGDNTGDAAGALGDLIAQILNSEGDEWMAPTVDALIDALATRVGGRANLDTLDADPIADEATDYDGIAADVVDDVRTVVELLDGVNGDVLDIEYRTVCRRLAHDVAVANPTVFRRGANPKNTAAALAWIAGKTNHLFGATGPDAAIGGPRLGIGELMGHFGVRSVAARARSMAADLGADGDALETTGFGTTRYLVSSRRAGIIAERDRLVETLADLESREA